MVVQSVDKPPSRSEQPAAIPPRDFPASPPVQEVPQDRSWWPRIVALCTICIAGYFAAPYAMPHLKPLLLTLSGSSPPPPPPPARTVPVVTAKVRRGDMPLYLNGLGSVTPFYTVTIRSRVDGELLKVHFSEGQMVEHGDLLAEIDPRPFEVQLTEAAGQLIKDEAALWVADLDLKRNTELKAKGAIPQQQLDAQMALVKQSEGAIKVDRGQIDNAKLQLTYAKITAPIGGRIGLRMVDPGNMVRANDPNGLAVITQLQPIALVFTIPQDDIVRVQKRMKVDSHLVVEAWDRDLRTKLGIGSLVAIDNQVDLTTGTVRLKATFENKDELLFPNQFVNARLLVDVKRGAVIVPAAAIQRGPESSFVYVVKSDSTVELRNVRTGPTEGTETAVEQGLSPGESVVTDGIDKLQPGTTVVPREPDAAAKPPEKKSG